MKIALATDHAGFELKEYVKVNLLEIGLEIHDFGAYNYDALAITSGQRFDTP